MKLRPVDTAGAQPLPGFDFRNPNYVPVLQERLDRLAWIRADKKGVVLKALKAYYADHIADFINDWGVTFDPKMIERKLPSLVPFLLFPRQREWVDKVIEKWRASEPLLTEKTRQMGFSWLAVATACSLCLFHPGMAVGFGSRKEEYVDKIGDPKSLFYKAREFMKILPPEFTGEWTHAHMRITFGNGASIAGEAGDNIGRGATTSIYFVDEAAFLERPALVDASLSQTTNCRVDISTPNGLGNTFAEKRFGGNIEVFTFHWRDDPRKDDAWYAKQVRELDAIVVAQEIDIDYAASVEGVLIPSAWVQSAFDAHVKLGIDPSGARRGSLDVADKGKDKLAFGAAHGVVLVYAEDWSSPADGDLFRSTEKAFALCDQFDCDSLTYDADGMGAAIRGDARVINERRKAQYQTPVTVVAFRGSGAVEKPDAIVSPQVPRRNKDYFLNAKAQSWFKVRQRFQMTHRAVVEGMDYDPDQIISLASGIPAATRTRLMMELSQPTWAPNTAGKMVVDKTPDDTRSPNLADMVMMLFGGARAPLRVNQRALEAI